MNDETSGMSEAAADGHVDDSRGPGRGRGRAVTTAAATAAVTVIDA